MHEKSGYKSKKKSLRDVLGDGAFRYFLHFLTTKQLHNVGTVSRIFAVATREIRSKRYWICVQLVCTPKGFILAQNNHIINHYKTVLAILKYAKILEFKYTNTHPPNQTFEEALLFEIIHNHKHNIEKIITHKLCATGWRRLKHWHILFDLKYPCLQIIQMHPCTFCVATRFFLIKKKNKKMT